VRGLMFWVASDCGVNSGRSSATTVPTASTVRPIACGWDRRSMSPLPANQMIPETSPRRSSRRGRVSPSLPGNLGSCSPRRPCAYLWRRSPSSRSEQATSSGASVNVSGFHVDPNYEGRLIFAVFNAGPGPVHLSRGEECFLIWYADLDQPSQVEKRRGYDNIPSALTGRIAGGLQSFAGLLAKINENDKKLGDRVATVEREQAVLKWAAALAIGALITLGLRECSISRPAGPSPPAVTAPSPTPRAP
jgi:hypothetical protein